MGHTLDELLDVSGLAELRSNGLDKTAAAEPAGEEHDHFLKLAERCERAAAQAPAPAPPSAAEQALQEKTAAIAVIASTLAEVEAITGGGGGEKVAADGGQAAAFIERALASGHDPEAIAAFIKEAGFFNRTMHSLLGRGRVGAGEALKGLGGGMSEKGVRHFGVALRDAAQNLSPASANRYIERLRAAYGDKNVRHLVEQSGARLNHVASVRDLLPKAPSAEGKNLLSIGIGSKQHGITADQLKSVGKPAAAAAGGLAA